MKPDLSSEWFPARTLDLAAETYCQTKVATELAPISVRKDLLCAVTANDFASGRRVHNHSVTEPSGLQNAMLLKSEFPAALSMRTAPRAATQPL